MRQWGTVELEFGGVPAAAAAAAVEAEVSSLEKEGPRLVAWRRRQVTRVLM